MTYPPSGSGYPPGQQPTTLFSAPTQQFGKVEQASQAQAPAAAAAGPSKLPVYLLAVVAVCGLLVYLFSFGPMFTISNTDFPQLGSASGTSLGLGLAVLASLLAALLAGASLLPKQKAIPAVVAAISVLALLVIAEIVNKPEQVSIDWALYVVIAFTFLQAAAAIAVLLLDAGIISAPAPRPKYEQQQQYGQYGGPGQYYGQHAPHQGGAPQHQQRPGYSSQYGGYSGGSASGGFSAIGQQGGPPTPPTGFPTYGQPPASHSAPTGQVPAQPQQSSSSNKSGPEPS